MNTTNLPSVATCLKTHIFEGEKRIDEEERQPLVRPIVDLDQSTLMDMINVASGDKRDYRTAN